MPAYTVSLNNNEIDIVFFDSNMSTDEVRTSLINHDGYDSNITVTISFEHWLKQCDKIFEKSHTLSIHDMDDYMWMADFENDILPEEAVSNFIEDLGLDF